MNDTRLETAFFVCVLSDFLLRLLALYCPFCHALEDGRLDARDENGEDIVLLMFDCPFHFRFYRDQVGLDGEMQKILNDWREQNGDAWLDSVGPVMKKRELRNIEQYNSRISAQSGAR